MSFVVLPLLGPEHGLPDMPLRASQIKEEVEKAIDQFIGSKVGKVLFENVRLALVHVLFKQASMRGIRPLDMALCSIPIEMDVVMTNRVVVRYGSSWESDVDLALMNNDCARCGGLRTLGFLHTRDDCDSILARSVLDS